MIVSIGQARIFNILSQLNIQEVRDWCKDNLHKDFYFGHLDYEIEAGLLYCGFVMIFDDVDATHFALRWLET